MSGDLKEAKEQTDSLRKRTEQQFNSLAQTHAGSSQQHRTQLQDKMLEAESRSAVRLRAVEARVEQFEAQQYQTDRSRADKLKRCETVLRKRETAVESSLRCELQLLKQEYHKGFLAVHDAIDSLRQIGDIKSQLTKEKLQKDIRDVCSKMVQ